MNMGDLLPESSYKKPDQEESGVKLNDLPVLPFEKILGYLNLEDRIKSMAVSRRWYMVIDSFRTKSLCYSDRPIGFIFEKNRLISGAFAQNFIMSPRFELFFNAFGQSILFNLKHLRLCGLDLTVANRISVFVQTIESFGQLEELNLFYLNLHVESEPLIEFQLNLPMLKQVQLDYLYDIAKFALDAPKLTKVKLAEDFPFCLKLELVHPESVEILMIRGIRFAIENLKDLKNLKHLYCGPEDELYLIDLSFLSGLKQLKEIHLTDGRSFFEAFEQKQRLGCVDLKIYLWGCLLNDLDDPAINFELDYFDEEIFGFLAENPSRLLDEMPLQDYVYNPTNDRVPPGSEMNILNRLIDLNSIRVDQPVQDIQRFLNILKSFENIVELDCADPPQDLLDRLPDYCAVQRLKISCKGLDFGFLSGLKNLIDLELQCRIEVEFIPDLIRKVFKEFEFLSSFQFQYENYDVDIRIKHPIGFKVWIDGCFRCNWTDVPNLDAAIQHIISCLAER